MVKRYVFKLCCKSIAHLSNPCPGETISLKLDKCVDALGTVFCIEDDDLIKFNSQTINVKTEASNSLVVNNGGYYLINIASDLVEHNSIICVNDICIPVQADCIDETLLGQCVALDTFFKPVYTKETLGECWLRIYNHWMGTNYTPTDEISPLSEYQENNNGNGNSLASLVLDTLRDICNLSSGLASNTVQNSEILTNLPTYVPGTVLWSDIMGILDGTVEPIPNDALDLFDPINMKNAFDCHKSNYNL